MVNDPAEVRTIAKEAYIYGSPMVDAYRIQYAYFVDPHSPEFKAPWNELRSIPRVYTPDDTAVQTPNSDTPYSMMGLDLRAEPMVLTVSPIEKGRYFSVQLVDAYTHNFDYLGSRTTGNEGGSFLIAGPGWDGETPSGVDKVFRSETDFVVGIVRTQLFDPADLDNVKNVQAGYLAQPLSAFLGRPAPPPTPPVDFPTPLTPARQKDSVEFFDILDFILRFCPTHPSETALRARFAGIGIGAGEPLQTSGFGPEMTEALERGIADAWADFAVLKGRIDAKEVTAGDLFGTREYLDNNYLYRMAAAILGIYGNTKQEAMYPVYTLDADGRELDGSHSYILRFGPGRLPPVHAFWSLTMYNLPQRLLVPNPLDRYLVNSPMLPRLLRDADDGLTLLIQHESPGADREPNWLPAPEGPFWMVLRLYWPKDDAVDGKWTAPPLERL